MFICKVVICKKKSKDINMNCLFSYSTFANTSSRALFYVSTRFTWQREELLSIMHECVKVRPFSHCVGCGADFHSNLRSKGTHKTKGCQRVVKTLSKSCHHCDIDNFWFVRVVTVMVPF